MLGLRWSHRSCRSLTLAVVDAVDAVVVGGGPGLVVGGACVAEGGVRRIVVVDAGVPAVGVVGLLHLDCKDRCRCQIRTSTGRTEQNVCPHGRDTSAVKVRLRTRGPDPRPTNTLNCPTPPTVTSHWWTAAG